MPHKEMNLPHLPRKFWRRPASVLALAGCLSWAVVWSAAAQETCYRIVDLGTLGFTPDIVDIFGINNANQAVFTAMVGGKKHAMLYLPADAFGLAAGVHDLHDLAEPEIGDESVAHDINSAGIVVGWAGIEVEPGTFEQHAFVWRLDDDPFRFIDLGTFATGDWSEAWAISDDSPDPWIVGQGEFPASCTCNGGTHPLTRGFALELTALPPDLTDAAELRRDPGIDCENNTAALDINNGLQPTAAGFSIVTGGPCNDGPGTALYWPDPDPPDPRDGIAIMPGLGGSGSGARGISNLAAVSGFARTSEPQSHAVYWDTTAGPIVDLGSLVVGKQTSAWRINNNAPPGAGSSRLSATLARWARVCCGSARPAVTWWPVGRSRTSTTPSSTVQISGRSARLTTSTTMAGLSAWARLRDYTRLSSSPTRTARCAASPTWIATGTWGCRTCSPSFSPGDPASDAGRT